MEEATRGQLETSVLLSPSDGFFDSWVFGEQQQVVFPSWVKEKLQGDESRLFALCVLLFDFTKYYEKKAVKRGTFINDPPVKSQLSRLQSRRSDPGSVFLLFIR